MLRRLLTRSIRMAPSRCLVCHAWPAQPLCDACIARFARPVPRCRRCALPIAGADPERECGTCLKSPPPLDACLAAVAYEYPWPDCIASFKFNANPGLAAPLAQLLRSAPGVEPTLERSDLLLPMPLSHQRLRERGFNQALALARHLGASKTDATLLLRVRETRPQQQLHRAERRRNVEGAFALDPLRSGSVHGRRVALVDDVMTSGASLHAAARVLRQAGAAEVVALVVARTDEQH
jgi:ComF family protein